jgi:hypothetical protein
MGILKGSPKPTDIAAIGSPNDNQIALHFPDHTGIAYAVVHRLVMGDWSHVLNVNMTKFSDVACLAANMNALKDVVFIRDNFNVNNTLNDKLTRQ